MGDGATLRLPPLTAPPGPLPLTQAWRIVALTYELAPGSAWVPVVRHEFYGPTPERALEVRAAHMRSDAFLRACETGRFGPGVQCYTYWYPPERVT